MSMQRAERVTVARTDTGPPWSLWAVNFLTSAMVLGSAIIYGGKKSAMHYTMVAALGALGGADLKHPVPPRGTFAPVPRRDWDIPGTAAAGHRVLVATRQIAGVRALPGSVDGAALSRVAAGRPWRSV